jgi:hypothetical protein
MLSFDSMASDDQLGMFASNPPSEATMAETSFKIAASGRELFSPIEF